MRPADINVSSEPVPGGIEAKIELIEPVGDEQLLHIALDDIIIRALEPITLRMKPGERVFVSV